MKKLALSLALLGALLVPALAEAGATSRAAGCPCGAACPCGADCPCPGCPCAHGR